jgi:hypothetical protein
MNYLVTLFEVVMKRLEASESTLRLTVEHDSQLKVTLKVMTISRCTTKTCPVTSLGCYFGESDNEGFEGF